VTDRQHGLEQHVAVPVTIVEDVIVEWKVGDQRLVPDCLCCLLSSFADQTSSASATVTGPEPTIRSSAVATSVTPDLDRDLLFTDRCWPRVKAPSCPFVSAGEQRPG
jgi:hypothetical protein